MRLTSTLTKEIKEHGYADGSKYASSKERPIDTYDIAEFHDSRLWNFTPGDRLVRSAASEIIFFVCESANSIPPRRTVKRTHLFHSLVCLSNSVYISSNICFQIVPM